MTNAEKLFGWCVELLGKRDACQLSGLRKGNPIAFKASIISSVFSVSENTVTVTYKLSELDDTSEFVQLSE